VQANPHLLAAQIGVAPATAVAHTVPHLPQFSASVAVFTQVAPEQRVGVATGQPDTHP
jgi:hypothetical protein